MFSLLIPGCESCSIPRTERPTGETFNKNLVYFLEEIPTQMCSKG